MPDGKFASENGQKCRKYAVCSVDFFFSKKIKKVIDKIRVFEYNEEAL